MFKGTDYNSTDKSKPRETKLNSTQNESAEPVQKTFADLFRELFDWSESLITAMIAVVFIFTFIARTSVVDGDSMLPTLVDREFLILSNFSSEYNYNDIIVFWASKHEGGKAVVKRVIGLPGDTISIDSESGVVYRNGVILDSEVIDGIIYEDGHPINSLTYLGMNGEVTVPEGKLFVMGDNRNNSLDSRSSVIGSVDFHYIIGKAVWRMFPLNKMGSVY